MTLTTTVGMFVDLARWAVTEHGLPACQKIILLGTTPQHILFKSQLQLALITDYSVYNTDWMLKFIQDQELNDHFTGNKTSGC